MPDTVIDWVNLLEKYQQELLVFTDCRVQLIVDGDVDLTVVDGGGDENESSLKLKMKIILTIMRINRSSIPSRSTKPFNNPPK